MERSRLRRPNYHFANVEIPLPSQGVSLLECRHCAMLFKSAVPTPEAWDRVMLDGATDVWRPKSGAHPGLPMMRSHINGARSFRSEEHTSELQSLMRISYAVFCLQKKTNNPHQALIQHV